MINLLLIEINWSDFSAHNVWLVIAGFAAAILFLGTIAGAVKNVKGEFVQPFVEWIWKPLKVRRQQHAEMIQSIKHLTDEVGRIVVEVKTNGGSSLKDAVLQIREDVGRIEKHVDYANAKFRHHDQLSRTASFEMDEKANLTTANPALCNLLFVDERDLLERKWLSRIPSSERPRVLREWTEATENCLPVDMTYPVIVENRNKITVRVQATPRMARAGKLCGFFGVMTEIKENDKN